MFGQYQNGYPYSNGYSSIAPQSSTNAFYPKYEIIRVNGENGAKALQMSPNSNVIVMDDTAPMVWMVVTDGAGYKTATPFDITPHKTAETADVTTLESRVSRLEELINGYQSNGGNAKRNKTSTDEQK